MTKLKIGYFMLVLIHLYGLLQPQTYLVECTKPLLMPWLMVLVWRQSQGMMGMWWLLSALFGSWIGDLFLMLPAERYFTWGLGAFFCAHLCYIRLFLFKIRWRPLYIAPFIGYAALILGGPLQGQIPASLQLPLYAYVGIISLMGFTASLRSPNIIGYDWVLIGSILFILSDSIIAVHKFGGGVQASGLWVMSTYCLAQFLITTGYILRGRRE